ncbi:MAG: ferritin family protein [Candidatus Eisenbacteria sp.]|nr:ferritin family protein [Candidatus Eisenbacteria bacterium]
MDPATERIAAGLSQAIQAERDGQHFYKMAAETTQDDQGRRMFLDLANDELEHERFLRAQYDSVAKTGKIDPAVSLGPVREFASEHPMFSPQIRERIASAHFEMTALSVGIQLELSAIRFYENEAAVVDDPEAKAFYEKLAAWEHGHLTLLQNQAEELKEDYWHASGFAPF